MKIEIKANGKTIQTEINEEQAKILGLTIDKPKTGYERVEKGSTYFFNDGLSDMNRTKEEKDIVDQGFYDSGNYYSDYEIAKNNARADRLLCCLRQWQALNDRAINWKNKDIRKYTIRYDYAMNMFNVIPNFCERCLNLGDGWLSTLVLANDYISMVFIYHSEECRKLFKEVE